MYCAAFMTAEAIRTAKPSFLPIADADVKSQMRRGAALTPGSVIPYGAVTRCACVPTTTSCSEAIPRRQNLGGGPRRVEIVG